jgi:hypothetical protein
VPDYFVRRMPPDYLAQLFPPTQPTRPGLVLRMNPISGQDLVALDETANLRRAKKPIPIKCIMERFIERTYAFPCRSREKHAGLVQEVCGLEPNPIEPYSGAAFDYRSCVPEKFAAAIKYDCFIHASGEGIGDGAQRAMQVQIVAVEPAKDKASSSTETLIEGRRLPVIRLGLPEGEPFLPGADHINALVGAATVHHNIIEARISLAQDAIERFTQVTSLIEGRSYNRDYRINHLGVQGVAGVQE